MATQAGADIATPQSQGHLTGYGTKAYRSYVLNALLLVYVLNFLDRGLLGVVSEPVMNELKITDGQFGLLTGFAFALFYVMAGLPIARYADRGNRRNVVATSLVVWSVMTALCGMAQNYWQLLAARIGVGVGEAGGSPPSHSMISDTFPPESRATALSLFGWHQHRHPVWFFAWWLAK